MFGRRRTTIHNEGIPAQINNGNTPLRPSKSKMPFSFRNMGKRQTIIHPDMPQLNIEIANTWIENPLIDPYTKNPIELSIHPKSRYVFLYKKIIDELINDVKNNFPLKKILTIEDCKYIKNNLPVLHSIIVIEDEEYIKKYNQDYYIKYDHLFIKYFVKRTRKYKYDSSYREDNEIKLYLDIYNSIKTKVSPLSPKPTRKDIVFKGLLNRGIKRSSKSQSFAIDYYNSIDELLINNMDLHKTDLSLGNLVMNLCIDIRLILYMYEPIITIENYNIALNNKKVLEYVALFYKLNFVNGVIYDDIITYYNDISEKIDKGKYKKTYKMLDCYYIYVQIIRTFTRNENDEDDEEDEEDIKTNEYIFKKLIDIYDIIISLYSSYFTNKIDPRKLIPDIARHDKAKGVKLNPYCPKDADDPITIEQISELDDKKRKYIVNIISYSKELKKVFYFCFDTIAIYNHILWCIQTKMHPYNPFDRMQLIDEQLDEICDKIKYFTTQPTYNSHADIKYDLYGVTKYNNHLVLSTSKGIDIEPEKIRTNGIIGSLDIYISINLKDIIIPIINSRPIRKLGIISQLKKYMRQGQEIDYSPDIGSGEKSLILTLPIFKEDDKASVVNDATANLQTRLEKGDLLFNRIFPYRDGIVWNKIINLFPFEFDIKEDADVVFARFEIYQRDHIYH
jgi:hypothetical protein